MILTADRESLLAAVKSVRSAASGRVHRVCNGVMLRAEDLRPEGLRIEVIGSDLTCTLVTELPSLSFREPGTVVVDPKRLVQILDGHSDEYVLLEFDPTQPKFGKDDKPPVPITGYLNVRLGRTKYSLAVMDPSIYPTVRVPEFDSACCELPAHRLGEMIRRVRGSAGEIETQDGSPPRFDTDAVLIDLAPEQMSIVATDGIQIAVAEYQASATESISAILPPRSAGLIAEALKSAPEFTSARVQITATFAAFQADTLTAFTTLAEGRYPPWRKLVAGKTGSRMEVSLPQLASLARSLAVVAENGLVTLTIGPDGVCRGSAQSKQKGRGECTATLGEWITRPDEAVEVSINSDRLLRAIHSAGTESARLEIDSRTLRLRKDGEFLYSIGIIETKGAA